MHKSATKCNETLSKWCKNKHGASKIMDTFETYHRDALKLGLICRIGDGTTTKVWGHNWLSHDERLSPVAALKEGTPEYVSGFIDQTLATWNVAKLEEFFIPMDVYVIKGIPICTRVQDDFWAWHFKKSGGLHHSFSLQNPCSYEEGERGLARGEIGVLKICWGRNGVDKALEV
jgi:hypothetical protein